jgi:hypothetical protein
MEEKLIAPCGMNCGVCVSYLAMKNDLNKQDPDKLRQNKRYHWEKEGDIR